MEQKTEKRNRKERKKESKAALLLCVILNLKFVIVVVTIWSLNDLQVMGLDIKGIRTP